MYQAEEGENATSEEGTQKKRNYPIFMVGISLLQIGFFIYDHICITKEGKPFGWDDNSNYMPLDHPLILNKYKKIEIWRFYTHAFVHAGGQHLFFNMLLQLVTGIPLEMESGSLRVCLVHTMGVLVANFSLPSEYGYGGSGGSYCIAAAKLTLTLSNAKKPPSLPVSTSLVAFSGAGRTAIWVFVIFCMTVGVELFTTYQCYASGNPHWYYCRAHFAHLTASIEGVCLGLIFLNKDNGFGKTKTRLINGAAVAIPIVTVACLASSFLFPETLGVLLIVGGVCVLYAVTCCCFCWCCCSREM